MRILGIHDGHNSAACLLEDGAIVFAEQEERWRYVKNQGGMPIAVLKKIDQSFGLASIDCAAFVGSYMGQYLLRNDWSREQIIRSYTKSDLPMNIVKQWVKRRGIVYAAYRRAAQKRRVQAIKDVYDFRDVEFLDHHLCHASAAYYGRGDYDKEILVITADGEGDGRCGSVHVGKDGVLKEIVTIPAKDSLGRLYSYITYLYNMVPYEHEYKVMGLAPYCTDRERIERCKRDLHGILDFGSNSDLTWHYKGKYPSIQAAGREIKRVFHRTRFDVMAAAIQEFTEEMLLEWIRRLIAYTRIRDLALSGGLFMNVKTNMLIAKLPEVRSVFVFPSCGDESNAIGAAYLAYFLRSGRLPQPLVNYYLGSDLAIDAQSLYELERYGIQVTWCPEIEREIARLLANGQIVGRVCGPMEFGARSLGNRAILANPSVDGVIRVINEMIKGRDFWMPFAPSVLAEDLSRYFSVDSAVVDYEYMIFTAESLPSCRRYAQNALHPYDFTGRPQAVRKEQNPRYHALLTYYKELTGESLILNTSYNLHGFPMVRSQQQAVDVFLCSGLKYLALGDYLLKKRESASS